MDEQKKIAVLGGGVAGLSVAHQLSLANKAAEERGEIPPFLISVFDAAPGFGGKCRTFAQGDEELAGEHGFRFFPGFYQYVTTTMSQIPTINPSTDAEETVEDRLVPLKEAGFYATGTNEHLVVELESETTSFFQRVSNSRLARWLGLFVLLVLAWAVGRSFLLIPIAVAALLWFNLRIVCALLWMQFKLRNRIPRSVRPHVLESLWMFLRISEIATSSRSRMVRQRDEQSWWSFVQAWSRTEAFQLSLATGLTRTFVATRAEQMSARTGGSILNQLLYDINPFFGRRKLQSEKKPADRVLKAPTTVAWIDPWITKLKTDGVLFNEVPGQAGPASWGTERGPLIQSLKLAEDATRIGGFGFGFADPNSRTPRPNPNDPAKSKQQREKLRVDGAFDDYVMALSGTAAQQVLANSPEVLALDLPQAQPGHELNEYTEAPTLSGVFGLEFGWMSGVVYHLDEAIEGLPNGHLLCLQSEYALTILDQKPHWDSDLVSQPSGTILSVNLSDWFTPARTGLPARYKTLDAIADEVWGQMVRHIPELADAQKPERSQIVFDFAISDPEQTAIGVSSLGGLLHEPGPDLSNVPGRTASRPSQGTSTPTNAGLPFDPATITINEVTDTDIHLTDDELSQIRASLHGRLLLPSSTELLPGIAENLALANGERLLINTTRSWANRPSTTTSFENLYVAGDYVRTYSDFASMEAADESARWVAQALWKKYEVTAPEGWLAPTDLDVPEEIFNIVRFVKWLDRGASRLGMPHILTLLSVPVGFAARVETALRGLLRP